MSRLSLATACVLIGCGGAVGEDELTLEDVQCAFQADLTGAITRELPLEDQACAYSLSIDSGVSVVFITSREPTISISLAIEEVTVEDVGDFPARLSLVDESEHRYQTAACTATVITHEPDPDGIDEPGSPFRLRGTGTCSGPAESVVEPGRTVNVSDFQFAMPASWSM